MNKKKIALSVVSLAVMGSLCVGGYMVYRNNTMQPVEVMDVSLMNTSSWYMDQTELTGQITSEFIQEVIPDTSRTIKKIYVKEGQKVKVGDKLLKYDVEEKELDLKLQELQIKGSKFEIEKMEKELEKLKKEKTVPDSTTQEENSTTTNTTDNTNFNNQFDNQTNQTSSGIEYAANLNILGDSAVLNQLSAAGIGGGDAGISSPISGEDQGGDPQPSNPEPSGPQPSGPQPGDLPDTPPADTPEDPGTDTEDPGTDTEDPGTDTEDPGTDTEDPGTDTEDPGPTPSKSVKVRVYCMGGNTVIKPGKTYTFAFSVESGTLIPGQYHWAVSDENIAVADNGDTCTITIPANYSGSEFTVSLVGSDLLAVDCGGGVSMTNSNYNYNDYDDDNGGYYDYSSFDNSTIPEYKTVSELKDAIFEKESDIAKKKQELAQAKISYKEAQIEIEEATVKAKIKGKVTTAYTKKSAPSDGSPIIIIKAEDGIYVQTSVSELDLKTVKVGGTLTCTSWNTDEKYTAEIISISDYPLGSQATNGSANPNSSYYKVVGFIAEAEGLSTNDQVTVSYNSQSMGTVSEDTIYLPKAYVRTEGNRSYVFKNGKGNKLVKQYVKIGSYIQGGQYLEIESGLKTDDQIAFPYGKNVIDGAKTVYTDDTSNIIF